MGTSGGEEGDRQREKSEKTAKCESGSRTEGCLKSRLLPLSLFLVGISNLKVVSERVMWLHAQAFSILLAFSVPWYAEHPSPTPHLEDIASATSYGSRDRAPRV